MIGSMLFKINLLPFPTVLMIDAVDSMMCWIFSLSLIKGLFSKYVVYGNLLSRRLIKYDKDSLFYAITKGKRIF